MRARKLLVEKQSTETSTYTDTNTETYDDEYYSDTDDTYTTTETSQTGSGEKRYVTISKVNYRKPPQGTIQDNFSKDEILRRLQNCIPLKTMREKKILEEMPIFKTWIRYYNVDKRLFRVGGLLLKVSYPDYIMLVNPTKNLTWSVQLRDNIIYIPDPRKQEENQKQKQKEKREQLEKERMIKDKLYEMYKGGKLAVKK